MKPNTLWRLQSQQAITVFFLAFALVLTAIVVSDLQREYANEIKASSTSTATLAQLLEEQARQSFKQVAVSLNGITSELSAAELLSPLQREGVRRKLHERLRADGLVEAFSVADSNGLLVLTTRGKDFDSTVQVSDRDYFEAHRNNPTQGLFVGATMQSKLSGQWITPVSVRIGKPGQAFQGVLFATLSPTYFQNFYDSIPTGTSGFITLFTRQGWITVRSPRTDALLSRNWLDTPMFKEHLPTARAKTVRQVVVADGIERLYSYRALEDYPVVVSVGVSLTDVLAPWRKRAWFEGIALVLVLSGLGIATLFMVRQLRRNSHIVSELKLTVLSVNKASLPIFWIAPNARILRVNHAACQLLGYSEAELLGKSITELDPDFPPERWPAHWEELREKKRMCFETTQRDRDGRIVPVEVDLNFIEYDGQEYNFAYIRNISVRKQAEAKLVHTTEAAKAAALSKGQFLANMSHEIRTPMNAILGMLQLLRSTPLTPQQLDYASKAASAAQSLLGLINDILDFSKIDAGKLQLDQEPFTIDSLQRDLAVLLGASVGTKPIEVVFEVDPGVPACLRGDAMRLQQVLTNLGSNAVKFTAQGAVRVQIQLLAKTDATCTLRFAVKDSGIGIAPQDQARIFTEFSQAEASTTRRFGGTGLGLAICKRLVEAMGGALELDSALGQGSTFYFTITLPIAESVGEVHTVPAPPPLQGKAHKPLQGMRLLVVEDNHINQQVAKELLAAKGASVALAQDGQLGVQAVIAADPPFDAVLMDIQMPVMDGYTATRAIRQKFDAQQLPIIAMTANAMASDRAACLDAGMNDHVGKPFDIAQLTQLLLHHIRLQAEGVQLAPALVAPAHGPVAQALERMGGNKAFYAEILQAYLSKLHGVPEQLATLLAHGDWLGAKRLMHTIKGLSATVGAEHMAEVAALAEKALKDAPPHFAPQDLQRQVQEAVAHALLVMDGTLQSMEPSHD